MQLVSRAVTQSSKLNFPQLFADLLLRFHAMGDDSFCGGEFFTKVIIQAYNEGRRIASRSIASEWLIFFSTIFKEVSVCDDISLFNHLITFSLAQTVVFALSLVNKFTTVLKSAFPHRWHSIKSLTLDVRCQGKFSGRAWTDTTLWRLSLFLLLSPTYNPNLQFSPRQLAHACVILGKCATDAWRVFSLSYLLHNCWLFRWLRLQPP